LEFLPPVKVVFDCYNIGEPARINKPINPVAPDEPEPPVQPGAFVPDDDDAADAEELHELAVEAYEQQKEQYDAGTSPACIKYEKDVLAYGFAMMTNKEDWKKYHAYKKLIKVVSVWRYGNYTPSLSCAGGTNLFGPDVRHKHFPDSFIEVGKKGSKKNRMENRMENRMCITEVTEAYGLLQYENCRSRWEAIFKHQAEHRGTVPAYNKKNPETHAFKAKWSDDNQGSGSGWDPAAYTAFDAWLVRIVSWRKEEVRAGYKRWAFVQAACKELHEEDGDNEEDA
jgi:hypothetical protein